MAHYNRSSVPLGYLGAVPTIVPDLVLIDRDPTVSDLYNYSIGTIWVVSSTEKVWVLVNVTGCYSYGKPDTRNATWLQLNYSFYDFALSYEVDTGVTAIPVGFVLKVIGGLSIYTSGDTNVIEVSTDDNWTILGTLTVDSISEGVLYVDDNGLFSGSLGSDGQVLIGDTVNPPQWAVLESSDGSITIGNNPNEIDLTLVAGPGTPYLDAFTADVGIANPDPVTNKVIIAGGDNISTTAAVDTITIDLNKSILQPVTNASGAEGLYSLGGNDFMHAYGTGNTFLGESSGNRTLTVATAVSNTGIGKNSLNDLSGGGSNLAIGFDSSQFVTGGYNSSLGVLALYQDIIGTYNISIGYSSGSSYTTNESSNICINNYGAITESNKIRIGTHGSGSGQQDGCYVAGIYNTAIGATNHLVSVDDTGKLGLEAYSSDGEVLISSAAGLAIWKVLDSSDGSIIYTLGANSIDMVVGVVPGGGLDELSSDSGNALPAAGVITISGGDNINTSGAADTITINLDKSILQPITNAFGTEGLYELDNKDFLHNYGTNFNVFMGLESGNRSNTANSCVGLGSRSLLALTSGSSNVSVGFWSGLILESYDANSILGSYSANNNLSPEYSVAIGYKSFSEYPTGLFPLKSVCIGSYAGYTAFNYNTLVGSYSLYYTDDSLTGSSNTMVGSRTCNVLPAGYGVKSVSYIGYNSGSVVWNIPGGYSAKLRDSILIGNMGVVDYWSGAPPQPSSPIRIGDTQALCYISGIYGKAVTGQIVICQTDGHIVSMDDWLGDGGLYICHGTNGVTPANLVSSDSSIDVIEGGNTLDIKMANINRSLDKYSFCAYQPQVANDVTGDGTLYYLGTQVAFSERFDYGNNLVVGGGGNRVRFTAPITGYYYLFVSVGVQDTAPPPPPPVTPAMVDPLNIETTNRTYSVVNPVLSYMYNDDTFMNVLQLGVIANMSAGHTAVFSFGTFFPGGYYPPGSRVVDISSSSPTYMVTYVCGFMV